MSEFRRQRLEAYLSHCRAGSEDLEAVGVACCGFIAIGVGCDLVNVAVASDCDGCQPALCVLDIGGLVIDVASCFEKLTFEIEVDNGRSWEGYRAGEVGFHVGQHFKMGYREVLPVIIR